VTSSIYAHLVIFAFLKMIKMYAASPSIKLVSHGQTLFLRERVWDMATEQFVAPHYGVRTNHSTVFSHMIPEVCD